MRLKTLKELVDEFGNELSFNYAGDLEVASEHPNNRVLKEYLHMLTDPQESHKELFKDLPAWAIKKPEKKKLYAYRMHHGQIYFSESIRLEKEDRAPEYDLEF